MSPARSRTRRCLETACAVIGKGSASSPTVASPAVSRSRIARRVGSARAAKVALSSSVFIRKVAKPEGCIGYRSDPTRGGKDGKDRGDRVHVGGWRRGGPGRRQ